MLFNSIEFLVFFLPAVLAIFLVLQRRLPARFSMAWLTASSLFFYGWWNPRYLLLILASIGFNYAVGQLLYQHKARATRGLLIIGVGVNLGLLGYFKYFNFFVDSINVAFGTDLFFDNILLPLAISFFTFQQITYLVDNHRGLTQPHGLLDYCLFVSFFPQLIAGPIVHHSEMLHQFRNVDRSRTVARNLAVGGSLLAIGLFKKVVVADTFALLANPGFDLIAAGEHLNSLDVLTAVLAYTLQLYFDFSGYSDMAVGLAVLFGVRLPANFNSPYQAGSIIDFWRRWHMTLSRFLRDYLYIPLGGNKHGEVKRFRNILATMFLGGLWHGANWTFAAWGLLHGLFLVANHLWRSALGEEKSTGLNRSRSFRLLARLLTFFCVALAWIFFRAEDLPTAAKVLTQLADLQGWRLSELYSGQLTTTIIGNLATIVPGNQGATIVVSALLAAALWVCWFLPNSLQLFAGEQAVLSSPGASTGATGKLIWRPTPGWGALTAAMTFIACLHLTRVTEFLYFQF